MVCAFAQEQSLTISAKCPYLLAVGGFKTGDWYCTVAFFVNSLFAKSVGVLF